MFLSLTKAKVPRNKGQMKDKRRETKGAKPLILNSLSEYIKKSGQKKKQTDYKHKRKAAKRKSRLCLY